MVWDENKFHSPQQFKPERFLPKPEGAGEELNMSAFFGWGRRLVCCISLLSYTPWTILLLVFALAVILPKNLCGAPLRRYLLFSPSQLGREEEQALRNRKSRLKLF